MKKYYICFLFFLIWANVYSYDLPGKKWWEFWKTDVKTVGMEKTTEAKAGANHFRNYNWIYEVKFEGDTAIFISTGGIVHFDLKTGKYTYEEKQYDRMDYGMYVGPWMDNKYLPAWFPKD